MAEQGVELEQEVSELGLELEQEVAEHTPEVAEHTPEVAEHTPEVEPPLAADIPDQDMDPHHQPKQ